MRVLVVGYGSIGSRHARILHELNCEVAVVSSREIDFNAKYKTIKDALELHNPEYVVVANKTIDHYTALLELARCGFTGIVLAEKPLFDRADVIPLNNFSKIFVAYNLRFHPLLQRAKTVLQNERILSAHAYVGQYLPDWRPGTDYRECYSAHKHLGGGVLRDLSHEIDYMNWLCGDWSSLSAVGGHFSQLEIDSDDVFSLMMTTNRSPIVTIQMSYIDRVARREVIVNTERYTIRIDFIKNTIAINDFTESFSVDRDFSYRAQHQAIINQDYKDLCSTVEGIDVMQIIHIAEQSAQLKRWFFR